MPLIGVALPYTPFGHALGFTHLPLQYYPILIGMVIAYLALVEQAKSFFYRAHPIGAPVAEPRPRRVRRISRRAARFSQVSALPKRAQPTKRTPPT